MYRHREGEVGTGMDTERVRRVHDTERVRWVHVWTQRG